MLPTMATLEPLTDFAADFFAKNPEATMLEAAVAERLALRSKRTWTLGDSLCGIPIATKRKVEQMIEVPEIVDLEDAATKGSPPISLERPPRTRLRTQGPDPTEFTLRPAILNIPMCTSAFPPTPPVEDQCPDMETGQSTPITRHDPGTPNSECADAEADDEMTLHDVSEADNNYLNRPALSATRRSINRRKDMTGTGSDSVMSVDTMIGQPLDDLRSLETYLRRVQFGVRNDVRGEDGSRRDSVISMSIEGDQGSVVTAR